MMPSSLNGVNPDGDWQVSWEDGERVFYRAYRTGVDDDRTAVLIVVPAAEHPSRSSLDRLIHEYELKDELDGGWAVRPLDLVRDAGTTMLVLEDAGGEPLDRLLGAPMDVGRFLRLAIGIAAALGKLHQRGLVHIAGRDPHFQRGARSPPGQVPVSPVAWGQAWRGNLLRRSRPDT